ncbi:MAG: response regulator transcription factor [Prevotella sp.]|jgi:two-component system copper resistance phosphate regulon response regulator CusR|nr:response regulator transcription factor [Prevotella sp.]MCI1281183.1 response regulator transcription factor [Prevotella sp.]
MNKRILMAEDEENISDFVSRGLSDFKYDVTVVNNGLDAWKMLEGGEHFDLVMLDIRMPGMTGLEVCEKIREHFGYEIPVLMLTALDTTDDIVMGLHVGADDYIVKPFRFMELLARIQAMLRRSDATKSNRTLACGDLHLDSSSHKAIRGDYEVDLSIKEYRLLEYMMEHHGEILSRRQLLKDVWNKDFDTNTNIVDVYVRYLRSKIDDDFKQKLIHTVVGTGYCLRPEEE